VTRAAFITGQPLTLARIGDETSASRASSGNCSPLERANRPPASARNSEPNLSRLGRAPSDQATSGAVERSVLVHGRGPL